MLNIVIPLADKGIRFFKAGFAMPKPLVPVHGVPMVRLVIENTRPACAHRYIFVCQKAHLAESDLERKLLKWAGHAEVLEIDGNPEGDACTALGARELIDNGNPLLIAAGDQFVLAAIDDFLAEQDSAGVDGALMTMRGEAPDGQAVALDRQGFLDQVGEQKRGGTLPAGIASFRHGRDFVRSAEAMMAEANDEADGDWPVAPVMNALVAKGARIAAYDIGRAEDGLYSLATPDDLDRFLAQPLSRAYAGAIK